MLTMPPPSPLDGDLLSQELAAVGLETDVYVSVDGLHLPNLDDSHRAAAQPVVEAHPPKAQAALGATAAERTNETTIRDKAAQALDGNKTFLALTSPTNAQTLAQVKALTRQNNALIRLVLRRFDSAD